MSEIPKTDSFQDFKYRLQELYKYIRAGEIFTIMLKDGTIVHHESQTQELFEQWLTENGVDNIRFNPSEP